MVYKVTTTDDKELFAFSVRELSDKLGFTSKTIFNYFNGYAPRMNHYVKSIEKITPHEFAMIHSDVKNTLKKPTDDYMFEIRKTFSATFVKSWDEFCLKELRNRCKELGITDCLVTSDQDFKLFLEWAIPRYKKEVLNQYDK